MLITEGSKRVPGGGSLNDIAAYLSPFNPEF